MTYERRYLGISAGLAPQVPADPSEVVGYRLPTEAEREYAARGGNKSEGFRYAGNDKISEVAWFDRNSEGMTQEVGLKLPNELGLFDMSGSSLNGAPIPLGTTMKLNRRIRTSVTVPSV